MRILIRQIVQLLFFTFRNPTFLIFKNKMITADNSLLAFYQRRNAMCDYILNLGMLFFMQNMSLQRLIHNCIGNRMRIMLFQACCYTKGLFLFNSAKGFDCNNLWCCMGQRTCFIKNNGISRSNSLQEFAALYRNIVITGLTDRRKHG